MDFLKYFKNDKYELGLNDCWTFTQTVFKNEKGIKLPDLPVINETNEGFLKTNVKHRKVDKAHEGCLIFVRTNLHNHAGYAISEKVYIHKTSKGVKVALIPKNAEIFEIIND